MSEDTAGGELSQAAATRRHSLGAVLKAWRSGKGLSVENAAEEAGLSHMTWRRLERGGQVWAKSYAMVDALLNLSSGTVLRCLDDDTAMTDLAHQLGVGAALPVRPVRVTGDEKDVVDGLYRIAEAIDRLAVALQDRA